MSAGEVWTIGHSTRSIEHFTRILRAHDIELVADVRRFPASRRFPQFSSDALAASLDAAGIMYQWLPALGGRRRPDPESPNVAWTHPAFRAYADHLETEEFASGLAELTDYLLGMNTTVMCSELLWWRCHRRLVADVLVSLGFDVLHIRDEKVTTPHRLAPPAQLVDGRLSYREE